MENLEDTNKWSEDSIGDKMMFCSNCVATGRTQTLLINNWNKIRANLEDITLKKEVKCGNESKVEKHN